VKPRLCLSLYGNEESIREHIREHEAFADLFEIRVDLSAIGDFARIRRTTQRPLLFTGNAPAMLLPAVPHADYLDPGEDPGELPREKLILSRHAPGGDPQQAWDELQQGNALTKIVFETRDYSLVARLLKLCEARNPRGICFAMGEAGAFSRILAAFRGAPWIYTSPEGAPTAAGQFPIRSLLDDYRIRRFDAEPRVFGIAGDPVSHSRSPRFHNARFAAENLPWIYLPFLCDSPSDLFTHAAFFGVIGLSITHPHKRSVLPLLQHQTPEVAEMEACNTVCRIGDEWHGANTDLAGARALLEEAGAGGRIVVLGAGGAARAAVAAARPLARDLIVLNRTPQTAPRLSSRYQAKSGSLNDLGNHDYDVLINATSCGMRPGDCPVDPSMLRPGRIVVDVIYEPKETELLKQSRQRGCRTFNGEKWFEAQAEAQFHFWRNFRF